jgi:hypothetical protein
MKTSKRRLRDLSAALAAVLYLSAAVGYRVASRLDVALPALAPLYHALPGGLAGAALYVAWTGLRGRQQELSSLTLAAGLGAIVIGLVKGPALAMLASVRSPDTTVPAAWEMICDLSAITILFALLMSASLPFHRRRPAPADADRTEA